MALARCFSAARGGNCALARILHVSIVDHGSGAVDVG
jgi:hypothetical protein